MIRAFPIIAVSLFLFASQTLFAQLVVAPYFSDHMVIQRDQPITVWGTGTAGTDVAAGLSDQKGSAKADDKGRWKVALKAMPAGGPFEVTVTSGSDTKVFKDVMVGDVWLISGQSNVVLAVGAGSDWPQIKTTAATPAIRLCKLPGNYSFEPADSYPRPVPWQVMDPPRVSFFSGVGFHFARTLQPAIGVTLGVLEGASGGTEIEQWTPDEALKAAAPDSKLFAARDKARAALAADPAAKIGATQTGAATLYNGTIAPFRFAKFAGVVWYQGEANSRTKADYRLLLKTLVKSWREVFGEPELPFVIVQLPGFGLPKDDGWMRLQEYQALAARDLGLGLAVTVEQGSKITIHPPNKAEVGRRVAMAALQHAYKKDVEGSSPMAKTVQFTGDSAVVEFDGFKGDLAVHGDAVNGFELAGDDHAFKPATAKVEGRRVTVRAEGVPQPKAIRYLWANWPESVTLFSAAGLPAAPFRSDKLPEEGLSPWFAETAR